MRSFLLNCVLWIHIKGLSKRTERRALSLFDTLNSIPLSTLSTRERERTNAWITKSLILLHQASELKNCSLWDGRPRNLHLRLRRVAAEIRDLQSRVNFLLVWEGLPMNRVLKKSV